MMIRTESEFDAFTASETPVALFFTTSTCTVCKVFKPKVEKALEPIGIEMEEVNLQETPILVGKAQVMGVPILAVYQNGREIMRENAYTNLADLSQKLSFYKA